ncbi:MAG: hypothetical protein HY918_01440 [Candidatus Doudnabacteria bacterium]|nr:hypothetical protein [Candidatus Doudnabacteria bacterium]
MTPKQKFLLAGIIILAVFFRYFQITHMPGGLFPDEAANGLDINLMQSGHLQPFYERGNGREALFFYMLWGSVEIFGKGPWQHHIVSALIGVLSVLMCFLVARRIFTFKVAEDDKDGQNRAVNIALLATFLMAVSTWHIVLSRTAFRAVCIPLFASLTFYFLIKTYQAVTNKKRIIFAVLTGASFALGFYTYIAFRIMAPALFAVVVWPMLGAFRQKLLWYQIKKYFLPSLGFLVAFLIVIFPIGKYFYDHPGSFIGRAGQVSVFNPELYSFNGEQLQGKPPLGVVLPVVVEVARVQIMGFFTQGDLNWRSNISGQPFLSQLYSPFFAIGLILITLLGAWYFFAPNKKEKYWPYFLLAVWFWGMLLPVVTTAEGIPHGLRAIGVIPAVFIISAFVLYEFGSLVWKAHQKLWGRVLSHYKDPQWMKDHALVPPRMRLINAGLKLVVVCFIVALSSQAYLAYFVYAANSPENFYYFRSDLTQVSKYLVDRCNQSVAKNGESTKNSTYLVLDKFSVQTTDYFTSDPHGNFNSPCNVPYIQVDPEDSWKLQNLKSGDEVVFTQSSMFDTKKFKAYHPEFSLAAEFRNQFKQSILAVYKIKETKNIQGKTQTSCENYTFSNCPQSCQTLCVPSSCSNDGACTSDCGDVPGSCVAAEAAAPKKSVSGYDDCIKNNGQTGIKSEAAYCKINNKYYYAPVPAGTVN